MSYSFSVKAASKAEALAKVDAELNKVVAGQPMHAADSAQASAAATAFVAILQEPSETQVVCVSVNGSLSWDGNAVVTSASVGVYASLLVKA